MSAHTPGPWTMRSARLSGDVGIAADGFSGPIAEVFEELNRRDLRPETARANARLIAAAPDLLAVLGVARDALTGKFDADAAVAAIDAAIAKAVGK